MTKDQHFDNFEHLGRNQNTYAIAVGVLALLWFTGETARILGAVEGLSLQYWLVLKDYIAGTAFLLYSLKYQNLIRADLKTRKILVYLFALVATAAYTSGTYSLLQLVGFVN